jgi:hypothetical protein
MKLFIFWAVPSWSCSKAFYNPVWHIPLLSVQWINSWWRTEELPETCKVSCQNKFVKLVHLVGFIIKKHCLIVGLILHPYTTSVSTVFWEALHFNNFRIKKTFFPLPFVTTNQPLLLIRSPMGLLNFTTWWKTASILQVNKILCFKISCIKTNISS